MEDHPHVSGYPFKCPRGLDLHPAYKELRENHPVARVTLPPGGPPAWVVTGYHSARYVLVNQELFSREQAAELPGYPPLRDSLLGMDLNRHARVRRVAARAFTPRRVEQLRPRIQHTATQMLEVTEGQGPPADLIESVLLPLPLAVIGDLLGVPTDDRPQFQAWGDAFLASTKYSQQQAVQAQQAMGAYLADLINQRRSSPDDDLLSAVVHDETGLSDSELVNLAIAILVGGFETTATMAALQLYYLLTHPEHLAYVREDLTRLPAAIEELLRTIPLGEGDGLPRIATRDVELEGSTIRKGDLVFVSTPSANFDDEAFAGADSVDFTRPENPHLGFGHGPHYCLGANLARAEIHVVLATLLERLPGLRLGVAPEDLAWKEGLHVRGLKQLPVEW
ncbi:cytochrome P450 [Actinomadura rudentiformis]|uniref:Cytochrome P450 n=2 Tax=Actinomadura rudentiformis TaxID=359158 RepID=A0A6H9YPQ6_9ACTN|nr:cytochrome P450 [Actinomadura rudentiformis]